MASLSVKAKVADRVKDQQPEFIQDNHELLIKFLEEYYKFLEQEPDGSLDVIRSFPENIDVDTTDEVFLEQFKKALFPAALKNVELQISERELIKNLRDFYLSKGTEEAFNFVMQKIFANSAELKYGRDQVFRTSDNEYLGNAEIILTNLDLDTTDLSQYVGTMISQKETVATAIIDDIILIESSPSKGVFFGDVEEGVDTIINIADTSILKIGDVIGYEEFSNASYHSHYHLGSSLMFPAGTQIVEIATNYIRVNNLALYTESAVEIGYKQPYYKCILNKDSLNNPFDHRYSATILSRDQEQELLDVDIVAVINKVDVENEGSIYESGTKVTTLSEVGSDVDLRVGEVTPGSIDYAEIIDGGTGYSVGDKFNVVPIDGRGIPGLIEVANVDGYGAELLPILELTSLILPDPAPLGFQVGDKITLNIPDRYGANPEIIVTGVAGGTGLDKHWMIYTNSTGFGYKKPLNVAIVDGGSIVQNVNYTLNSSGSIIVEQILPNTTWSAPQVYVGGQGAYGSVTISSNKITAFTMTSGGLNYTTNSIFKFFTDLGRTVPLAGSQPRTSLTLDGSGSVTGVAVLDGGFFDVANGTYYFEVHNDGGSGADIVVQNFTYITSYNITYAGEYIVDPKLRLIDMSTDGSGLPWLAEVEYDLAKLYIVNPGSSYINPTLSLVGGSDTPPVVTLTTAENDSIFRINVLNGGSGYLDATVNIIGDGNGAMATANIVAGTIESITVTDSGTGYKNAYATVSSTTGIMALLEVETVRIGGIIDASILP